MSTPYFIKNSLKESKIFKTRLTIAIMLIISASLLLLGKLIQLQIVQHDLYITLSKNNHIDLIPIPPRRGLIYDRNGVILAKNIPAFSLMVLPSKTKNLKKTIKEIRKIIPLHKNDLGQLYKQLKQHRRFEKIPLKLKLSDEEIARFAVDSYRFPGISIEARLIRYYPFGESFAHVLGYVGRINTEDLNRIDTTNYAATNFIGKIGIEKYYENQLHGQVGYEKVEIDAAGRLIRKMGTHRAVKGEDLYLTIDKDLQLAAEKALGENSGAVVAIQPQTGQVLALVSQPSFNPNLFINGISHKTYQTLQNDQKHPLYNRALRGLYAPGSTVKPFIALEGLNTGTITPTYTIYDPGWYKLPNNDHVFHNWKRSGHGQVNLRKAMIVSCDTLFYELARLLGIQGLSSVLSNFGFGQLTGIDLGEELSGNLPTPEWKRKMRGESWYTGDTIITGIGQGFMQTSPLQLAVATTTLANRGLKIKPTLLYAEKKPRKKTTYNKPVILNKITLHSPDYWQYVIEAMQKVITQGTGKRFGLQHNYTVAGKTGTAQVVSIRFDKNHEAVPIHLRDNTLFIAFAPVYNPEIALAIVIENNSGASIVARKTLDAYWNIRNKPSFNKEGPHDN